MIFSKFSFLLLKLQWSKANILLTSKVLINSSFTGFIFQENPELDIFQENPELDIFQENPKLDIFQENPKLDIFQENSTDTITF